MDEFETKNNILVRNNTDLTEINTYEQLKDALGTEICRTQTSFVRIGYLLRRAADTSLLYESRYRNMEEFALAEFNLTKGTVSRFININKRFSEGGYSDRLSQEFQAYGAAKLQEMLTLPDSIIGVITPEHTKEQIREIKQEFKEEQDITEIELMQEEKIPEPDIMDTLCKRFLYYYFKTEEGAEVYVRLYRCMAGDTDEKKVFETMAPSGVGTLFARVPQVGKLMMTITGMDKQVSVLNMRSSEKGNLDWKDVIGNLRVLMPAGYAPEECWEMIYAEDFPRPVTEKEKEKLPQDKEKNGENPVTNTSERHFETAEKEPENNGNTLPEKEKPKQKDKKEEKRGRIPEPKTEENVINTHADGQSDKEEIREENTPEPDKTEEYLEYIRRCIREHRWQQALFTIRDLSDEVIKLRDRDKVIDIPGQMSLDEMEGSEEDEAED